MSESNIFFVTGLAQTTPFPLGIEVERAEGLYVYKKDGSRIMDFVSGVGVSNLGHGIALYSRGRSCVGRQALAYNGVW